MYFRKYRLPKTWLDHSLKTAASEYRSTVSMLKGLKDFRNVHENTFIIFFHRSEEKWFPKHLPYWSFKQ